jgi:hypothetical protein
MPVIVVNRDAQCGWRASFIFRISIPPNNCGKSKQSAVEGVLGGEATFATSYNFCSHKLPPGFLRQSGMCSEKKSR